MAQAKRARSAPPSASRLFTPEFEDVLCYLLKFLPLAVDLSELAAVEMTSRLFGAATNGVVATVVRDTLKAMAHQAPHPRTGEGWTRLLKAAVAGPTNMHISAGNAHSLIVRRGSMYSFGSGAYGKLGQGGNEDQWVPRSSNLVCCLPGRNWRRARQFVRQSSRVR